AIVRVDRVLRAPEQMEQIAGRDITVQLRQSAAVGTTAVFETDGWLYGESMAVLETGRRRSAKAARSLEAEADVEAGRETPAAAARATAHRSAVQARAEEASAVVVGRVVGVRQVETAARAGPGGEERQSEHDPRWAIAEVEVDESLKGRKSGTIEVLFASSEDVMWYRAPKLVVGQKATMLLQKGAPEVEDKRADAVVDELDVQPADTAEILTELR
ncbi:MAG: hypothetical protein LC804_11895, partial [Acidobacteria bacterium]|nr:hypothetical protein [Acidobacteriota bacterium]